MRMPTSKSEPVKVTLAEVTAAHPIYQVIRCGRFECYWSKPDWVNESHKMQELRHGFVVEMGGEIEWHATALSATQHLNDAVSVIVECGGLALVSTPMRTEPAPSFLI